MAIATATEMQNNFGRYLNLVMSGQEIRKMNSGCVHPDYDGWGILTAGHLQLLADSQADRKYDCYAHGEKKACISGTELHDGSRRGYAKRYDWIVKEFINLAFTFMTDFLYYMD